MKDAHSMAVTPGELDRIASTFSRDDTFTVLYILTKAKTPYSLENLRKRYGAPPSELIDRLNRLVHLGLAGRRGRDYVATGSARVIMSLLEKKFGSSELPAVSASASEEASIRPIFVFGNADFATVEALTNNGTLFSIEATVEASSGRDAISKPTEPVNEGNVTGIADTTTKPHADRSQLYL